MILGLTLLAFLVHGYHPYSEDGGLYVAGIKHLLDPALYPYSGSFVDAHLRFSLFAPAVALLVRVTSLSLPAVLLLLYVATIALTLYATSLVSARWSNHRSSQAGAICLMAAWLTLPVAGTSLILVDPYLTARSIALPCTLFLIVAVVDFFTRPNSAQARRAFVFGTGTLVVLVCVHPLMAAYGLADALLLACLLAPDRRRRLASAFALCGSALVAAAILQASAPAEPAGYLPVVQSRYYWFLSQWHWYEILGLIAPLAILSVRRGAGTTRRAISAMALLSGVTASLVALLFAHESGAHHLVARLQPLRAFQVIYVVMIISLGSALGRYLLARQPWRGVAVFLLLGGVMFGVQRQIYSSSSHVELSAARPLNVWQEAFVWVSRNTPNDTLFALDANYITAPGEDAQSFRAIAERSALPDFSKDGGETSITPSLTGEWSAAQRAQNDLSTQTDAERTANLHPLKADWLILRQDSTTAFDCPFHNRAVKVCRLP